MADDIPPRIEAVFAKLALVYGSRLDAFYRGQEIGTVKAHWAHELRATDVLDLEYALVHLPADFVPNVLQFKALCARSPLPTLLKLPPPKPARERIEATLAALAGLREALTKRGDAKAWARDMRARELAGERLPLHYRAMWREALKWETVPEGEAP